MGIPVARIELVNALQMRAMIELFEARLSRERRACSSNSTAATRASPSRPRSFGEIAAEYGGGPFLWTSVAEERTKLWKARHDAYWASLTLRPGAKGLSTDVCVPISRLAECIAETEADIAEHGLIAPIVGHVGDGNFHVLVLMDVDDPREIEATEAFVARLNMRAIAMDGTCTGEHGIGQGKIGLHRARARRTASTSCARSSRRSTRSTSSTRARYCRALSDSARKPRQARRWLACAGQSLHRSRTRTAPIAVAETRLTAATSGAPIFGYVS